MPRVTPLEPATATGEAKLAIRQMLPMQIGLAQSGSTRHTYPGTQPGQVPPPQSTSVSAPSLTPSLQVAVGWQEPPMQVPPAQAVPSPLARVVHWPPTQTPSLHAVLKPEQSASTTQLCPTWVPQEKFAQGLELVKPVPGFTRIWP